MNISTSNRSGRFQMLAGGLLLLACGMSTGCQIDVAGQTLPSPYHLSDDVQYYAPGPEFKLANEAAALAEQRAQEISEPQGAPTP
ncbi:hypothetical protein [Lacipirellula limnantheis]|uniref:Uncharacterized protein n=1 Tax=Lacipirellula limnantheis TaxID=2528024 RepID=A0A517TT14_9BACT|nr:hypothetical protein [Lacipirellula limnantheis]QDT71492.1 hypothetical protein I41_06500 [Lacipirellula limnantheis]